MMSKSCFHIFVLASLAVMMPFSFDQAGAQTVSETDILQHIEILASDEYEGRMPGTEGEIKTLVYIANAWSNQGLVSGTNDPAHPWYVPVKLTERTPYAQAAYFTKSGRKLRLPDQIVLRSRKSIAQAIDRPLIFVGYGIDAQGNVNADVTDKIAIMLLSSADFDEEDAKSFTERRLQLSAAGAAAVLVVFDVDTSWTRISAGLKKGSIGLSDRDTTINLEGSVSAEFATRLFDAAGLSWKKASENAQLSNYTGVDLPIEATLMASTQVRDFTSYNVIAKLPGKDPEAGAILMLGHWDHIGICRGEGAPDRICNGAVDNASGIAVLIETARHLAAGPQLDRDVYFMGTTAEEQGLLGAYAYTDNPNIPLKDIVVALNVDTIAIAPRDKPVAIIGRGETSLDSVMDKIALDLGREIETGTGANAFIRRQDGWALTAKGVPSLMIGGSFSDMKLLETFLGSVYHGPGDEVRDELELGGAAQDTDLHIALARYFGNKSTYSQADWAAQRRPQPSTD